MPGDPNISEPKTRGSMLRNKSLSRNTAEHRRYVFKGTFRQWLCRLFVSGLKKDSVGEMTCLRAACPPLTVLRSQSQVCFLAELLLEAVLACQGAHFPLWERQAQKQASGTTHLSHSAPFSRQSPRLGTPEEETPARPDLKLPFASHPK